MQKLIIYFNDDTSYEVEAQNIEISAFVNKNKNVNINEFEIEESINLYKNYKENENYEILVLKNIMTIVQDKIIIKVVWINDDKVLDKLEGLIIPRWSLNINPQVTEVLNFYIIN